MKICEKIKMERVELEEKGPITIVAFGDSVTHGAVGVGEIDYETVYWNRLRKKINALRSYVPVNVINAGIGGTTANQSLPRLEAQVLSHNPDLVIVCFGLNDVNGEKEAFLNALSIIFQRCKESGADVIYMTPNMLNTYVADDTPGEHLEYAKKTANIQLSGKMDDYMESACALAREMNVFVCDCYAKWKELSKTQDTTLLLANRINHPIREMHELFAQDLFDTIFVSKTIINGTVPSLMSSLETK
ncbi:MAG: SGNH/GDSL hydrolase family protein [Clostridia bacterium]|nr:SGNH/GDSL hydrolase family protein [Clostridia bacterium]